MGTDTAGFALSFPPTLSSASSPRAFPGRCHCRQLGPCSPTAASWQPPLGFLRAPPACPHACAALALAPSPRKLGGGPGWRWPRWPSDVPRAARPLPPSTMEAHPSPCCLRTCWARRQTHTNPQLSTELESGFLEISTRESPFLGFICSDSGLPVRPLDCSSSCFSVPFPWCFISFGCKDSQVTCYRDSQRVRKEPGAGRGGHGGSSTGCTLGSCVGGRGRQQQGVVVAFLVE